MGRYVNRAVRYWCVIVDVSGGNGELSAESLARV
jgi:hypothetical protein